jgi:hypothetical protein
LLCGANGRILGFDAGDTGAECFEEERSIVHAVKVVAPACLVRSEPAERGRTPQWEEATGFAWGRTVQASVEESRSSARRSRRCSPSCFNSSSVS